MDLKIVARSRVIFSDRVESVVLPAAEGEMGVLAGHADFVVMLKKGQVRIQGRDGAKVIPVAGGYAGITGDQVLVLAGDTP
jgi:F-type H+-transporting ATPase subunit epsilon